MDVQNVPPHMTLIHYVVRETSCKLFVHTIVDRVTSLLELYILLLQVIGRGVIIVADEL